MFYKVELLIQKKKKMAFSVSNSRYESFCITRFCKPRIPNQYQITIHFNHTFGSTIETCSNLVLKLALFSWFSCFSLSNIVDPQPKLTVHKVSIQDMHNLMRMSVVRLV